MNIVETALSIVAPHICISCGQKGYVLCPSCAHSSLSDAPSRCYRCHATTVQHQVCRSCRSTTGLTHVWITALYEGVAKDVLEQMKFHRASAAAYDIARAISDSLPLFDDEYLVTHAPTARSRIRQRGFDQSQVIARDFAKRKKLAYSELFERVGSSRQLGTGREQRFLQAKQSFKLGKQTLVGKRVIIVDDVTTSGATIETLAVLCKKAGARSVDAAVFAQAID